MTLCIVLFWTMQSPAVVTTADGDPNTNAPTFDGGAGWNTQGILCNASGTIRTPATIIGSNKVLKSTHVAVSIGNVFSHMGTNYTVTNIDTLGKLQVLEVSGTFPIGSKAVISSDTNEFGKVFVTFGCSGPKEGVVTTSNLLSGPCLYLTNFASCGPTNSFRAVGGKPGTRFSVQKTTDLITWKAVGDFTYTMASCLWLDVSICKSNEPVAFYRTVCPTTITNGWKMGAQDGKLRWGMNRFEPELDNEGMLTSRFNLGEGPNESAAWATDSSGGCFSKIDGVWKLVAVNEYSFTSQQYQTETGEIFQGVICDDSGLSYYPYFTVPLEDGPSAPTQCGYVRISDYAGWLAQFTQ